MKGPWLVAKSLSTRSLLGAPLVPRWTIGLALVLFWGLDMSSLMLEDCARTTCSRYMTYAQIPGLFLFPYLFWWLLMLPTQSFVFAGGGVLALCVGTYWIARRWLPPRLSLANLVAVLGFWAAASALGFALMLFGVKVLDLLRA